MKTLFKLIKWAVVVVVALVVVLFLGRNFIARKAVEVGVKQKTGFPMEIASVDIGIFSGTLDVRGLKLLNPPEFQGGTFVDLPLFHVDYDTMSMLGSKPHLRELIVNVEQVVIVKNEKGESNTTKIQNSVSGPSSGGEKPQGGGGETKAPKEEKKQQYKVDLVKIHIGTVIVRDYTSGKLKERTISLNADATYKDIDENTSITALVMNTVFNQLGAVVGDVLKGVGDLGKGAADKLQQTGKGLLDIFKKK